MYLILLGSTYQFKRGQFSTLLHRIDKEQHVPSIIYYALVTGISTSPTQPRDVT